MTTKPYVFGLDGRDVFHLHAALDARETKLWDEIQTAGDNADENLLAQYEQTRHLNLRLGRAISNQMELRATLGDSL